MSNQDRNSTLASLLPTTIIELYEIDLGEQEGLFRFHPGAIGTSPIYFGGNAYYSVPIDASGFESRGDGRLPRPTILIANADGIITDILKQRADLVGSIFTRKRVYLKYIDSNNFPDSFNPFAIPNPDNRFEDDYFIINRKTDENKFFIQFELVSPLEYEDAKLPARIMIANYCPWVYRGHGCKYGKRVDFINQEINNNNVSNVRAESFFITNGSNLGNLGLPVADDNDKPFFEEEGYNLTAATWRGDYENSIDNYVKGDIVRIKSKFENLSKLNLSDSEEDLSNKPDSFYICIKDVTSANLDPRYKLEFWRKDECSRKLVGCGIRYILYGEYSKGLPYGGFPSTQSYKF
jgi:lambda family phage minor tail protein L